MDFDRRSLIGGIGAGAAFSLAAASLARAEGFGLTGGLSSSAPEAMGVSSEALSDLLAAFAASPHELHSMVLLRHGHAIARGSWAPYRPQVPQLLYSLSKSFTSTAVGFAVAEGRLKLDDRVTAFFPDRCPAVVSANLAALQVRHLLTMSVGHAADSTPLITHQQDWVRAFLALPIDRAPGSEFLYDSGASYMLSAIVQKVTGQKLIDYLRPRLFHPAGMGDVDWAICPMGVNTGGWGLKITSDALARFGQLYLQDGQWESRQLLPAGWAAEASRAHIRQPLTGGPSGVSPSALLQISDWHQGYGYQFWRCRHGAYRGDGAFGQFCVVMPKERAVAAITSFTSDMQGLLNLVWDHFLSKLRSDPLPPNPYAARRLASTLAALALARPPGALESPVARKISGHGFGLDANTMDARSLVLHADGSTCRFELDVGGVRSVVTAGMGRWIEGFTSMPGTPPEFTELVGRDASPPRPVRVAAAAAWPSENRLEMQWRYCETPHHDTVTCLFEGDRIRVSFRNNITVLSSVHAETRPPLSGQLAAAV